MLQAHFEREHAVYMQAPSRIANTAGSNTGSHSPVNIPGLHGSRANNVVSNGGGMTGEGTASAGQSIGNTVDEVADVASAWSNAG